MGVTARQLLKLPTGIVVDGFTSVGGILRGRKVSGISKVLLSLNISSCRLSATRHNFSCRGRSGLSVHVDRDNLDTRSVIGSFAIGRLDSVF